MNQYFGIIKNGLYTNNQAMVALLGLCPLMAVSSSVANALGLAVSTLFVTTFSNLIVSLLRHQISYDLRVPVFVMLIALLVVAAQLLMQAFWYDLYKVLGIFVPLIVTNCMILARAEAFAYKNGVLPSLVDGFAMGCGFGVVILLVGAIRELFSRGTLFTNMQMFFEGFENLELSVIDSDFGMLVFALPAGAFWVLGMLIALKNFLEERKERKRKQKEIERVNGAGQVNAESAQ